MSVLTKAIVFLLALPGLSCAGKQNEAPTLTIGDQSLHPLPSALFGQFLERPSWEGEFGPEAVCDERGALPKDVERHLSAMHAPTVRFPGGTDIDFSDWTDMIDLPGRAARPETIGHSGGRVGNRFGFDEYFELAGRMRWKTILVVNLRDALHKRKPLAEAAAHAAALVAYCGADADPDGWAAKRVANGHPQPWRLAAVQVGNEGWCFWPPKPSERAEPGLMTDAECARWLRECLVAYADAIHHLRPDLPLIADAPRLPGRVGAEDPAAAVWREAVSHPDIRSRYELLAAHAYAPGGFGTIRRNGKDVRPHMLTEDEIWYGLVTVLGRFDAYGQCIADADTYDDIKSLGFRTAVTEWNWNGWNFRKTFPQTSFDDGVPAALGAAGFLHGMMRHPNVALATQSMLLGTRWGITSVRVSDNGSVGYLPQGEASRLLARHHGDQVIASQLIGIATVDSPIRLINRWSQPLRVAEIDGLVTADSKAWYVHLIHRNRIRPVTMTIRLSDAASEDGIASIHQLTGEASASTSRAGGMQQTTLEMNWRRRVLRLRLPPASVVIAVVPK